MSLRRSRYRWAPPRLEETENTFTCTKCRVCGGAIARGERCLFLTWGVEYAHLACGWERPEEKKAGT